MRTTNERKMQLETIYKYNQEEDGAVIGRC